MSWVNAAIAGFSAFQQIEAGKTANAKADLAATQSEYRARMEVATAQKTAEIIRKAGRRTIGSANAGYAAAGVVVGEGSAAVVEQQIITDVEHDAFQALLEGDRRALGLNTDASMTRIDGRAQRTASNVAAVTTALGSGYRGLRASGWNTAGPGWSGLQSPAPVESRDRPASP